MACSSSPWTKVVDLSNVAIGKLSQAALELNVNLDLLVGDAAEYKFEPTRFDLIVLFYHLDRNLFPKMVAALKPGGLLICKMSLQWDLDGGLTSVSANPLGRNELLLLVPELHVLYQEERPVRGRGVVEFIGRKSGDAAGDEVQRAVTNASGRLTPLPSPGSVR
jgi:SAM-dependent methyltransferase